MQTNQQNQSKLLTVLLAGITSLGFATAASAVDAALGVNAQVGAGAQVAPAPGTAIGGAAGANMGASGDLNGPQWKDPARPDVESAQDRAGAAQDRLNSQAEEMRMQAEEMRTQAQSQAEEKRAQVKSRAEEGRSQTQSQGDQFKNQAEQIKPTSKARVGVQSGAEVNRTARNKR